MSDIVIGTGAEAVIYRTSWLGRKAVKKHRLEKGYRHKELDQRLRAYRTKKEVNLISAARNAGICTPLVYDVDLQEGTITMQFVDGTMLKDLLRTEPMEKKEELVRKMAQAIASMHRADLVHGDLTTSNMILKGTGIWFIDFSLGNGSEEVEDKGVDLHLLKEVWQSSHAEILPLFDLFLETYKAHYDDGVQVVERIAEIEARGRYT